ncbi:Sulfolipid-1 exporter MmpL8 [Mycobacterium innocens]|uniref:Sulfolipid-1 exporter MmpL8 n=1 Tax=Mycobacterium innocens TaxID=2341083 RepID=A0A498Q1F7_9MYCO|nr:RND family transporter [Mycobacterium innocens]VBA38849.1 Sulfolipid-1 exporter MmpL8 [Mycobacterium innocens]
MSDSEAARPGGIFDRLGQLVVRAPALVIAFWIALAAVLAVTFPPLMEVAGKAGGEALPADAPTMVTSKEMGKAFGDSGKGSQLLVILTDENGLSPADLETYHTLVDRLHQANLSVQDFISTPGLHDVLSSKDNKAWNVPVMFQTDPQDPATIAGYKQVRDIVSQTLAGSTLAANYAGGLVTMSDLTAIGQEDAHLIEIGTAVSVLIILLIIYRNLVTMLVPLATIGISMGTAQGTLSALATIGLDVQTQTIIFMSAVMIGAGTDYAVFLISRYHDYVRQGLASDLAVQRALMSIGKVIAASAATVAVTFIVMVFCRLPVFSTVGPAISVSIVVSFVAAVSLLPAILVLIGRRGWIKPRRDLTHRFWRRTGTRIVRRPRIHLVASLVVLAVLAGSSFLVRFNYDDLKALPSDVTSVAGYEAMSRHFPQNMMTPMMLFIKSPRDLRNPSALADLEMMSHRISQLPDITAIRGLTRPNGEPLQQTKVSYQVGEVGGKLDEAGDAIRDHGSDLDRLVNGSNDLAGALAQVRDQVTQAVGSAGTLVSVLTTMKQLMGGDKTLNDLDRTAKLVGRMRALGDALSANMVDVANTVAWASPLLKALNSSPTCNADPACAASRSQLQALVQAQTSGTLNSITDLARSLQQTKEVQTVSQTIDKLQQNLNQAVSTLRSIDGLQNRLNQMQQGANALAQGSRAVADGVAALVDQTKKMGTGLDEASAFLLDLKHDAERPSMAGFNVPPQVLAADEFKKAAQIFISSDGHAARYLLQSSLNPFTTQAMDQVNTILSAARSSQPNTELSDATISLAGIPTGLADTREYYNSDINFIVLATIVIVFLILVMLLRAIIAPLYLIGSVLVSFFAALGLGVIVFQLILGKELHWSLPGLSFILLVAVGADYNMLLISRIRDESPHGVRVGVIRTVGSTGGVITSAGLIFAASMFGLLAATINTMVEAGFIIGAGILIDTFIVRTVTVPALAALIGQANWWPSKLAASSKKQRASRRNKTGGQAQPARARAVPTRKTGSVTRPPSKVRAVPAGDTPRAVRRRPAKDVPLRKLDFPITSNGKDAFVDLGEHALPLFGSVVLRAKTATSNGHHPVIGGSDDDRIQHSLPLFGPIDLPALMTNGNGHGNGNGNGHGNGITNGNGHGVTNGNGHTNGNGVTNGNGHTNGNGNGKQPVDTGSALPDRSTIT